MEPLHIVVSHAVLIPAANIDTDQIIPARFLKVTDKTGLGEHLFNDWRYLKDGSDNPDFPLNFKSSIGAHILMAGDNFGCGSSREHAPWALRTWGFQAIISTSFADIFRNNAIKNGIVPVAVDKSTHCEVIAHCTRNPETQFTVDVDARELTLPGGQRRSFPLEDFSHHCLTHGLDELDYLLSFEEAIQLYEGG